MPRGQNFEMFLDGTGEATLTTRCTLQEDYEFSCGDLKGAEVEGRLSTSDSISVDIGSNCTVTAEAR